MARRYNPANPIIFEDGTMQQAFRTLFGTIVDFLPIVGSGTPEGVVEARQFSLYIDSAGSTGSIEYRKMLPEIGGDRSMGWVLV